LIDIAGTCPNDPVGKLQRRWHQGGDGSADGTARIWDPVSGACLITLRAYEPSTMPHSVPTDPWSRRLRKTTTIKVWDATTGKLLLDLRNHIYESRRSNQRRRIDLLSSSFDGHGQSLGCKVGRPTAGFWCAGPRVTSAKFSPDASMIFLAAEKGQPSGSGPPVNRLQAHGHARQSVFPAAIIQSAGISVDVQKLVDRGLRYL